MKSLSRYKNPFYSSKNTDARPVIETDAVPIQYKGYLIYHRQKSSTPAANIWDVVKDKVCVTMMAGLGGAKKYIDEL